MLITYKVVLYLRAHNRDQVKDAIDHAFGSVTANDARIFERDPERTPTDTTERKDKQT